MILVIPVLLRGQLYQLQYHSPVNGAGYIRRKRLL